MKPMVTLSFFAACMLTSVSPSQERGKDELKVDFEHLNKGYDIKLKLVRLAQAKGSNDMRISISFEFTRNLDGAESTAMRAAFAGRPFDPPGAIQLAGNGQAIMQCYLFDADGVAFAKQAPGMIEGELTGKEGDAFRITQTISGSLFEKTKKLAFRMERAK